MAAAAAQVVELVSRNVPAERVADRTLCWRLRLTITEAVHGQRKRQSPRLPKGAAAGAAALSLTRRPTPASTRPTRSIGVAFLGVGGRCQAHIDIIIKLQQGEQGRRPRRRLRRLGRPRGQIHEPRRQGRTAYGQGLYPVGQEGRPQPRRQEARHQGLPQLLDLKDVDAVCHRHARPLARQDVASTPPTPARTSTAKSR